MNENITVQIDEKTFVELLTNYYKEQTKDESVQVTAEPKVKLIGLYENESIDVEVTLKSSLNIDSHQVERSERLTTENINEALNAKFASNDYYVKNLYFQTARCAYGYYGGNREPRFLGVSVNLGLRQMKQVLKDN